MHTQRTSGVEPSTSAEPTSNGHEPARVAPVVKLVRVPSATNGRAAMTQETTQRFGNYVLEERLAIGGMAEVFRARRVGAAGFTRTVCIKRILPTFCQDKPFVEMFIDEANTGAQLRHSNIVAIDDFGEVDGRYFLTMEFIQGVDASRLLQALVADRRSLPWEVGAFILREVLSGLDYAHRKKAPDGGPLHVVHRDVSPHNVLLSTAGEVKLTDFGIARARTRIHQTSAHVVKGKLAYMAPEQARAQSLDGRADLFAAGVSAFEWLANQRPFTGKNEPEIVSNLLKGKRERLKALRPDIPDALEAVIDGLLEIDRNRRIESASAALTLLDPMVSPSSGRLLAAIVAHYFYPHALSSAGHTGARFSPASLPPAPIVSAAVSNGPLVPVAPVEAAPPAPAQSPPPPRLSANPPVISQGDPAQERFVETRLAAPSVAPAQQPSGASSAPQPSQPSYPSIQEGSSVSLAAAELAPRDGSTAVSDVLEATPEKTDSRPMLEAQSSRTIHAHELPVRPQDAVTRTSMKPAAAAPDAIVASEATATSDRDESALAAVNKRPNAKPPLALVLAIAAIVLLATLALAFFKSPPSPALSAPRVEPEPAVVTVSASPTRAPAPPVAPAPARPAAAPVSPVQAAQPTPVAAAPAPLPVVSLPASHRASARRARVTVASTQRSAPRSALPAGTLAITALPWAELTIDGSREGITPIYRRITAGTHRIVFVHPPTGRRIARTVRVASGEVTRLAVSFD